MHSLIHLYDDVRHFGALDSFSAFAFETELGRMKRLLRSGNMPLRQVCGRLSEEAEAVSNTHNYRMERIPWLEVPHSEGPTLGMQGQQFRKLRYFGYSFSSL